MKSAKQWDDELFGRRMDTPEERQAIITEIQNDALGVNDIKLTSSQQNALNALSARQGTGVFDRHNVLTAMGDRLGFTRGTWNKLQLLGLIKIEGKRANVTELGFKNTTDLRVLESQVAINDLEHDE